MRSSGRVPDCRSRPPVAECGFCGPTTSSPFPTDPLPALITGLSDRCEIGEELGRGGMAVVYRAMDRRHARSVAIKVMRPGVLASGESADRFLREIRFAAQLTHPHILPLYDSGEIPHADGAPLLFYVMPLIAGGSLRDRLKAEQRLPVDQAIRLVRAVGAALDYAHRRNIVHRDVKPENILLQEGEPVVADFGVARALCEECEAVPGVTEPGVAVGTPVYMSPEQATADPSVDGRSDQYALACVLYELLTGEPPFGGSGPRKTMARHATEAPRSPRLGRPEIPAAVERALLQALAKDPAGRYASVAEFCDALVTPLSGLPDQPGGRGRRTIAVLPFTNATPHADNEYVSDGITEDLIHALAHVEGLQVSPRSSVFALKGRHEDVRAVGALLGASAVLDGKRPTRRRSIPDHRSTGRRDGRPVALVGALRPREPGHPRAAGRSGPEYRGHAPHPVPGPGGAGRGGTSAPVPTCCRRCSSSSRLSRRTPASRWPIPVSPKRILRSRGCRSSTTGTGRRPGGSSAGRSSSIHSMPAPGSGTPGTSRPWAGYPNRSRKGSAPSNSIRHRSPSAAVSAGCPAAADATGQGGRFRAQFSSQQHRNHSAVEHGMIDHGWR